MRKIDPHGPGAGCVNGIQVGGNLVPDGTNHIPLFTGVDISCALSHPVAQVLALIPGDLGLKGTVRHEDPEGMPRKIHPEVFLEFLAGHSSAKPVEGAFRRSRAGDKPVIVLPNRGDEVVHALEHRHGRQLAPRSQQGSPPILSREGVLRADEGNRLLLDHHRRVGLGLPSRQLHRGGGDLESVRVRVLKVSTGPQLEPHNPTDEGVHRMDPRLRSRGRPGSSFFHLNDKGLGRYRRHLWQADQTFY